LLWNAESREWINGNFKDGKLTQQFTNPAKADFKLIGRFPPTSPDFVKVDPAAIILFYELTNRRGG
jgi:hypothetical protein